MLLCIEFNSVTSARMFITRINPKLRGKRSRFSSMIAKQSIPDAVMIAPIDLHNAIPLFASRKLEGLWIGKADIQRKVSRGPVRRSLQTRLF